MCCFLFVRVGTIAEIGAAKLFTQTFADRVEGRYVTLTLPGSGKILSLCEVEVYGYRAPTGENLGYYINKCEKYAVILMFFLQERTWPSKERPHSHHCIHLALRIMP